MVDKIVKFHGQLLNKSVLSEEMSEWLEWDNSLPEDTRLAVSAIPQTCWMQVVFQVLNMQKQ